MDDPKWGSKMVDRSKIVNPRCPIQVSRLEMSQQKKSEVET